MSGSKQSKKSKKEPKISASFKTNNREPRLELNPDSNRQKKPSWHVGLIDLDCQWSFTKINDLSCLLEILSKLKNFETMTWQEILDASGGRKQGNGNNHHHVQVSELVAAARKRLKDLRLDDHDSLFSLRLTATQRIWGILDGHVLKVLWLDDGHQVCPTSK